MIGLKNNASSIFSNAAVRLFQTPIRCSYIDNYNFPGGACLPLPPSRKRQNLTNLKLWQSPQTSQTSLQWRRGSVPTVQLAKGQCDSNTLLNKLLTVSLREMIIGILLLMLLCSPPPCWLNPANRWVIGPQWASAPTLPDSFPLYNIHLHVCCSLN